MTNEVLQREIKNKAKDDVIKKAIRGRSLRNTMLSGAMDGSIAGWQDYTLQSAMHLEKQGL